MSRGKPKNATPASLIGVKTRLLFIFFIKNPYPAKNASRQPQQQKKNTDTSDIGCVGALLLFKSCKVGVLRNPFFPSDGNIERINAQRDNNQQCPQQVAAEQLEAVAVKYECASVDVGVSLFPFQHSALTERKRDTQSNDAQQTEQKTSTNEPPETTCEF